MGEWVRRASERGTRREGWSPCFDGVVEALLVLSPVASILRQLIGTGVSTIIVNHRVVLLFIDLLSFFVSFFVSFFLIEAPGG